MKSSPPRLKDIAQHLGVSTATVSRALRNRPDISAVLREKVHALARELHYQPNVFARQFKSQRHYCLGVVVPHVMHQYMSQMLSGMLKEAAAHGYQVLVCETSHDYAREVRMVDQLAAGTVDGLLVCVGNHTTDHAHLARLRRNGVPFVLFDKDVSRPDAPRVVVDDFTGAFNAVEHLVEQGYRHIAHLQDNLVGHASQKRLKGYYSALKKHGLPKDPDLVVRVEDVSIASGRAATEHLLRLHTRVDAVFAITDELAVGALQAAEQLGLRVPLELGVVGFSNWQIGQVVRPSLTTVDQPGTELGLTATRLLLQCIEQPERFSDEFPTKILKTKLIVRDSSRRLASPRPAEPVPAARDGAAK